MSFTDYTCVNKSDQVDKVKKEKECRMYNKHIIGSVVTHCHYHSTSDHHNFMAYLTFAIILSRTLLILIYFIILWLYVSIHIHIHYVQYNF
jgi:hypothetical protein